MLRIRAVVARIGSQKDRTLNLALSRVAFPLLGLPVTSLSLMALSGAANGLEPEIQP
jgi:hypothetical protein